MECQLCLEGNKISIATQGYGYGYIGERYNCIRHCANNKTNKSIMNNNNNNSFLSKWSDNIPYDKTNRTTK
jgi:hypothetical protein